MSFKVIIKNQTSPNYIVQDFDARDKAFTFYSTQQGSKCLLSNKRVDECVDGKKCLGYAVSQSWVTYFSKDFRVLYVEEGKPKEKTGIVEEIEALKFYESLKTTKALIHGASVLKISEEDPDSLYLLLSDMVYINEEPKKIGFKIVRADSVKLKVSEGKCKICSERKANVIHEKCAHLAYCVECSLGKKDKICIVCEQESNFMQVKV